MEQGYLSIILHGHLPFVRHPEHDNFLEEKWLYEAITETYIPLILVFERLVAENIDFRITMTLSPTLVSMLCDSLLQERYIKHIDRLIELAEREVQRTQWQPELNTLAHMYLDGFIRARNIFLKYGGNLTRPFKEFQDLGKLEIISCAATHGYLPLMEVCRESIKAQVAVAVEHYKSVFGRPPVGFWLPECGYVSGYDAIFK